MRIVMTGVLAAALAGCAPSARDVSLAGLDLADGATLAKLQKALPLDDRAALGTYALLHWPQSAFYCGQPIGGRTAAAATVGEAIEQTRAYERALELAQAKEPPAVASAARIEETALVTRIEQLVYERDQLYGRVGPGAHQTRQAREINKRMAALRSELEQLRGARSF